MCVPATPEGVTLLEAEFSPTAYDLHFSLHPDGADGHGSIHGVPTETSQTITLHAAGLDIHNVELTQGEKRETGLIEYDETGETVTFTFARDIEASELSLELDWRAPLDEGLRGLYASTWNEEGVTHSIEVTQFQPVDARRLFPCVDEPASKAMFTLSVDADAETMPTVRSNGRVVSHSIIDGRGHWSYATVGPMSTYLAVVVAGELEGSEEVIVDAGLPVTVQIWHRPGKEEDARFALDIAARSLKWLYEYFDITCPVDKIDLVAVPDFEAGAMENLGCIVFKESSLLVNPAAASHEELTLIAMTVAHELTHMWFGDLVTMVYWDGLFLNEAFATWAEMRCVDALEPTWGIRAGFGPWRELALDIDALETTRPVEFPVSTPDEALEMFDSLTYFKGATLLNGLEAWIGRDEYQAGVRAYLTEFAWGNATSDDLWDAFEQVADVADVRKAMIEATRTPGAPLIRVEAAGGQLAFTQQRLITGNAEKKAGNWIVAFNVRDNIGDRMVTSTEECILIEDRGGPVSVNTGATAYLRVSYDDTLLARLLTDSSLLDGGERATLIYDSWADVTAGGDIERLYQAWKVADQYADAWDAVVTTAGKLESVIAGMNDPARAYAGMAAHLQALTTPVLCEYTTSARGDDSIEVSRVRAAALRVAGALQRDSNIESVARGLVDTCLAGGNVDGTLADAAFVVLAALGEDGDHQRLMNDYRKADDAVMQARLAQSLGKYEGTGAVTRNVTAILDGSLRIQHRGIVLAGIFSSRGGVDAFYQLASQLPQLLEQMSPRGVEHSLEGLSKLSRRQVAQTVEQAVAIKLLDSQERARAQAIERMWAHVAVAERIEASFTTVV